MSRCLRLLPSIALLAVLAAPVAAEERQTVSPSEPPPAVTETAPPAAKETAPAPAAPSMRDLIAGGYEVKAVTLVPGNIVKRGGGATDVDAVMITLQKESVLATCYDEFSSFASGAFVTLPCTEYK